MQFYTAFSGPFTAPGSSFSSTPNSYGQYTGDYSSNHAVYCAPGDAIMSAVLVINNFYQADTYCFPQENAVPEEWVGVITILNPTQAMEDTTYYIKALCLYQGTGTPPANNYQDSRNF